MKKDTLIDLGQLERVTDLVARPALDVAQRDDGSLARRQRLDGALDHLARLGRDQPVLGQLARRRRPSAGIVRMVVGEEAVGVDRRLGHAGWIVQRRERDAAALSLRAGLRGVDEDPEDPRLERRAALEAVERAEHAQPRLLDDFLGHRPGRGEDARDPEEPGVPLAHDGGEGFLVACSECGDELVVGKRHAANVPPSRMRTSGGGGPRGEFWARPPPR